MSETNPRFQIKPLEILGRPARVTVVDTWLGTVAYRAYVDPAHPEVAQLHAETRASELNLTTADPLGFVERLAAHIDHAVNEAEEDRGNVLEDVAKILKHWAGQVRGTQTEPLDQTGLYVQAPWVNRHGAGA